MRYVSTEGRSEPASLERALLSGPAPDGGLYVPEKLPELEPSLLQSFPDLPFADVALAVANRLFEGDVPADVLEKTVRESLDFDVPLVPVEDSIYSLELFHGPTLAFKDVGARFMARLMLHFLKARGREATVLVATSGDTGSAVAHAFFSLEGIRVVVLFPQGSRGRVSPLQRKLFTTLGSNVSSIAVAGSFDDCQKLAKAAFADAELTEKRLLVSANSINVGRLLPQTFYYFQILARLSNGADPPPVISTPSGNFGNLTAGLIARRMGLPVRRFVAATNVNDVVPRYLSEGIFRARPSIPTLTNAMDVGDPSNFARILWLCGHSVDELRRDLMGRVVSDEETRETIRKVHRRAGYLLDPHSAVGYRGAVEGRAATDPKAPAVFLSTAHPAKFRDVVEDAIGETLTLPPALAQTLERPEEVVELPPDYDALKGYLTS